MHGVGHACAHFRVIGPGVSVGSRGPGMAGAPCQRAATRRPRSRNAWPKAMRPVSPRSPPAKSLQGLSFRGIPSSRKTPRLKDKGLITAQGSLLRWCFPVEFSPVGILLGPSRPLKSAGLPALRLPALAQCVAEGDARHRLRVWDAMGVRARMCVCASYARFTSPSAGLSPVLFPGRRSRHTTASCHIVILLYQRVH